MGNRKEKREHIWFHVPGGTKKILKAKAVEQGLNLTEIIWVAIKEFLENHPVES